MPERLPIQGQRSQASITAVKGVSRDAADFGFIADDVHVDLGHFTGRAEARRKRLVRKMSPHRFAVDDLRQMRQPGVVRKGPDDEVEVGQTRDTLSKRRRDGRPGLRLFEGSVASSRRVGSGQEHLDSLPSTGRFLDLNLITDGEKRFPLPDFRRRGSIPYIAYDAIANP